MGSGSDRQKDVITNTENERRQSTPVDSGAQDFGIKPSAKLSFELTADQERALFKRFWLWLGATSVVAIALVNFLGGVFQQQALVSAVNAAREAGEKEANKRLNDFENRIADALRGAGEAQRRSIEIAAAISRIQGGSEEIVKSTAVRLQETQDHIKLIQGFAASLATKPADQVAPKSLAADAGFVQLVALAIGGFSTGAVVSFDTIVCPNGWEVFQPATGRFIVGAGERPGVSSYVLRAEGGHASVTLKNSNMPAHQHATQLGVLPGTALYGATDERLSAVAGASLGTFQQAKTSVHGSQNPEPVTLLPPFVALTVCKKL